MKHTINSRGLAALVAALTVSLGGCSLQTLAVNSLADALAESASVYASDPDPELVRDALPFALKTFESLLETTPENSGLLLATCSGFTQYTYAFVEADAGELEFSDYHQARHLQERALALYLRARDYCLRALELEHAGIGDRLVQQPVTAAEELSAEELDLIYWTAASWGAAISIGVHRSEIVADLPVVRALFDHALELDEDYADGALHEALISLEALPATMGGSRQRAEEHFARALELSGGRSASPLVSFAAAVLVPAQERLAFKQTMELALEIDPDATPELRLANHIAQRRARFLLAHADDLFIEPLPTEEP